MRITLQRISTVALGFASAMLIAGCAGASGGSAVSIAQITPILKLALPTGLQPGAVAPASIESVYPAGNITVYTPTLDQMPSALPAYNSDQYVLAQKYIQNMFQSSFVGVSGGQTTTGYLMSLVSQADGRLDIVNGQVAANHTCLNTVATPAVFDLTDISPVLTLTMANLQCSSAFASGAVATMATGAGEVFGVSTDNTSASEWTSMLMTTGGTVNDFINFAQISNAGSTSVTTPEKVDGLTMTYSEATTSSNGPTLSFTRYKACSTCKTFEMYFASNNSYLQGVSGSMSVLGAGFRMVSDGTYIYADGLLGAQPGTTGTGTLASNTWVPFAVCLNGSDLSVDGNMADCAKAYSQFTLATTAALNYNQLTGLSTAFHSIPMSGPKPAAAAATPSAAIISEITKKIPTTMAPANVTAF